MNTKQNQARDPPRGTDHSRTIASWRNLQDWAYLPQDPFCLECMSRRCASDGRPRLSTNSAWPRKAVRQNEGSNSATPANTSSTARRRRSSFGLKTRQADGPGLSDRAQEWIFGDDLLETFATCCNLAGPNAEAVRCRGVDGVQLTGHYRPSFAAEAVARCRSVVQPVER